MTKLQTTTVQATLKRNGFPLLFVHLLLHPVFVDAVVVLNRFIISIISVSVTVQVSFDNENLKEECAVPVVQVMQGTIW